MRRQGIISKDCKEKPTIHNKNIEQGFKPYVFAGIL